MAKKFQLTTRFLMLGFIVLLCCQLYLVGMMFLEKAGNSPNAAINTKPDLNSSIHTSVSNSSADTKVELLQNSITDDTNSRDSVLVTYPKQASTKASSTYLLTVNGKPVVVEKYNSISYAHFAFAGKADIEISVKENVNNYTLSPKRYKIPSSYNENKIYFSLTIPRNLILHKVNGKLYATLKFIQSNATIVNIFAKKMYTSVSGDAGQFCVTRTGKISQPLTVNYTIRGTAENGIDYQRISNAVTIPAGVNSVTITIKPRYNIKQERIKTVFLSLEN